MVPQWVVDILKQEVSVVRHAPLAFAFWCIVSGIVSWFVQGCIFDQPLKGRDDLLGLYRERLGLSPADKSPSDGKRNSQMAADALDHAK
jgi:hypothetical protein